MPQGSFGSRIYEAARPQEANLGEQANDRHDASIVGSQSLQGEVGPQPRPHEGHQNAQGPACGTVACCRSNQALLRCLQASQMPKVTFHAA